MISLIFMAMACLAWMIFVILEIVDIAASVRHKNTPRKVKIALDISGLYVVGFIGIYFGLMKGHLGWAIFGSIFGLMLLASLIVSLRSDKSNAK